MGPSGDAIVGTPAWQATGGSVFGAGLTGPGDVAFSAP
jgi:hypothetical protein